MEILILPRRIVRWQFFQEQLIIINYHWSFSNKEFLSSTLYFDVDSIMREKSHERLFLFFTQPILILLSFKNYTCLRYQLIKWHLIYREYRSSNLWRLLYLERRIRNHDDAVACSLYPCRYAETESAITRWIAWANDCFSFAFWLCRVYSQLYVWSILREYRLIRHKNFSIKKKKKESNASHSIRFVILMIFQCNISKVHKKKFSNDIWLYLN